MKGLMPNMNRFYFKNSLYCNQQTTFIRRLYYDEKGTTAMKTNNSRKITQG